MSRIIGLKLTHDAGCAIIERGRLIAHIELEKVANNPRHSAAQSLDAIDAMLAEAEVQLSGEDTVVVDGWNHGWIGEPLNIGVAPYHDFDPGCESLLQPTRVTPLRIQGHERPAISFPHVAGHVIGAYAMSPFSDFAQQAYALVWDGGVEPRLYSVSPGDRSGHIQFVNSLGHLYGQIYGIMGLYFGPYKDPEVIAGVKVHSDANRLYGDRSWPGKLMSWIGFGEIHEEFKRRITSELISLERNEDATYLWRERLAFKKAGRLEHAWMRRVMLAATRINLDDASVLATVHSALETMLVNRVCRAIPRGSRLVYSGGCALNIKWNSALRHAGFDSLFVPPCPDDSGAAIGAACAFAASRGEWSLKWNVYSGAETPWTVEVEDGWRAARCSPLELARLLAENPGEPVVVLQGRAEIGPRALGHRSIISNPHHPATSKLLNEIKRREPWRPVAPMCLEEAAPRYFSPGTPDPYMLFDHEVRSEWRAEFHAITHTDDTARLQTVGKDGSPFVMQLLIDFAALSGKPPILCNTSANLLGSGFFPDAASAMRWGGARFVWNDGTLFQREAT